MTTFISKYFILSALALIWSLTHGQEGQNPDLSFYADVLTNASAPENRAFANDKFKEGLEKALNAKNSFATLFSDIPWIFVKYDTDSTFRIISWQLEKEEDQFSYFNVFQKENGAFEFFGRDLMEIGNRDKLSLREAYGAIFYEVIPFEDYYLLSAYRRIDNKQTQKICDVLTIEDDGPVFGKAIFNKDENTLKGRGKKRVVVTYSSIAKANLNINANEGIIIFDHIVSIASKDASEGGILLVPDGSYEAYEYTDGGVWLYKEKLYDDIQATPLNKPLKSAGKKKRYILGRPK